MSLSFLFLGSSGWDGICCLPSGTTWRRPLRSVRDSSSNFKFAVEATGGSIGLAQGSIGTIGKSLYFIYVFEILLSPRLKHFGFDRCDQDLPSSFFPVLTTSI